MISVIIPAYNEEKYISDCLDSIITQTYSDLEIIVIDDGSTDSTPLICDSYVKRDNRITVIHKKNGGLVAARKDGLSQAHGEFISFIDADDWVDKCFVERLVDIQIKYACDVVLSAYYKQFGTDICLEENGVNEGFFGKEDMECNIYPNMLSVSPFFHKGIRATLCGKLLRKDILIKLYKDMPDNIRNGEDAAIVYPLLLMTNSIYVMNEAFYYYRQLPGSMSQKVNTQADLESDNLLTNRFLKYFRGYPREYRLKEQLREFMAQFYLQHDVGIFDKNPGELRCFGEMEAGTDVAVYGAGRFGKQVFSYLKASNKKVLWIDRNYEYYQSMGLPVVSREILLQSDIDAIYVAVIDGTLADGIRKSLIEYGISPEKILCIDVNFVTAESTFADIGYDLED